MLFLYIFCFRVGLECAPRICPHKPLNHIPLSPAYLSCLGAASAFVSHLFKQAQCFLFSSLCTFLFSLYFFLLCLVLFLYVHQAAQPAVSRTFHVSSMPRLTSHDSCLMSWHVSCLVNATTHVLARFMSCHVSCLMSWHVSCLMSWHVSCLMSWHVSRLVNATTHVLARSKPAICLKNTLTVFIGDHAGHLPKTGILERQDAHLQHIPTSMQARVQVNSRPVMPFHVSSMPRLMSWHHSRLMSWHVSCLVVHVSCLVNGTGLPGPVTHPLCACALARKLPSFTHLSALTPSNPAP